MSTATDRHPWRLVSPWWGWPGQEGVAPPLTRPLMQMYETSDLVNAFLDNPQRRLRFRIDDFVTQLVTIPQPLARDGRKDAFVAARVEPTTTRKLFLDTHKRFYLVVCELHCDLPGFPNACDADVCEAGFVIRRRRTGIPVDLRRDAERQLKRIAGAKLQLEHAMKASGSPRITPAAVPVRARAASRAAERLAERRAGFRAWAEEHDLQTAREAWIRDGDEHDVGAWSTLEEEPDVLLEEDVRPFSELAIPDALRGHAGHGRRIWFGLVPTSSIEHDHSGLPRFDDVHDYEVSCFVRRHDPCCPRRRRTRDCRGELVWSRPTEPYRLASQFDLVGTSNRPVTIQLPDIPTLTAQVAALPFGKGAPVRFAAGAGSVLEFDANDGKASNPRKPAFPQICSIGIPLITIVAWFVLRLFLPLVVLMFGLFVLLKLKFCILPTVSVEASANAELKVVPPSVQLDGGLDANVTIKDDLSKAIVGALNAEYGEAKVPGSEDLDKFGNPIKGTDKTPGVLLSGQFSNRLLLGMALDQAQLDTSRKRVHLDGSPAIAKIEWETEYPVP